MENFARLECTQDPNTGQMVYANALPDKPKLYRTWKARKDLKDDEVISIILY